MVGEIKEWLGTGSVNAFGPPFAGKDIQGDNLTRSLNAVMLGGGDILRGSDVPDHVRQIMNSGGLIPTPDYVEIVLPHLSRAEFAYKPLVLSSVGRKLGEEQGVMEATQAAGHPIKVVPFFEISPEVAFERLKLSDRKRPDDTPEALMVRFDEYQNSTLGVIDTYDRLGLMVQIDASGTEAEVYEATIRAIHEFACRS